MNESDTSLLAKTEPGSVIWGVSVRGWLAIMLTGTICGITSVNIVLACLGYTSTQVTIPEPLYSGFIAALGFYLGQIKK